MSNFQSTEFGVNASLELESQGGPYGNDVKLLVMNLALETETRLHVKVLEQLTNN